MGQPRIRKCSDAKEFERVVDDYAIHGYKITSRSDTTAVVEQVSFGSLGIHALLFIFTLGVGNIIYAAHKYSGREKVTIRIEE